MCTGDFFLGFLALLFPPLPVWVKCGLCSADSLLNLLLCMLGYVPGLLHAWYIIAKYPEPVGYYGEDDSESGRVAYVIVNQEDIDAGRVPQGARLAQHQQQRQARPKPKSQPGRQAHMSYGTRDSDSGAAGSSSAPAPPQRPHHDYNGEGSSEDLPPPPSYAEVVGDNKIQDRS
ncbi:hypothetical protein VPNG_01525 [Cytospora leucostoma]|uniref:Stress response RCI peptide n=1 Tax=Cytospora leucostoma TaxID=1230097 RepID=A0A423XKJ1_9PEZI|nr:hypothetical protein VPNG_01525 [Cytospora leucostoma]